MTDKPDTENAAGRTALAWEVSDYLRLLSWLCWFAAALSFFGIAGGAVTPTVTWIDSAFGLLVIGFVFRHVPEDVREMAADDRRGDINFVLRLLGWACWVGSAFIFFAIAGTLVQEPTVAWLYTAFGLFALAFALRRVPEGS